MFSRIVGPSVEVPRGKSIVHEPRLDEMQHQRLGRSDLFPYVQVTKRSGTNRIGTHLYLLFVEIEWRTILWSRIEQTVHKEIANRSTIVQWWSPRFVGHYVAQIGRQWGLQIGTPL